MSATLLGFDFGLRRIGVALGNRATGEARPLHAISNNRGGPDWRELDRLVSDWAPAAMVLGVPYNADGSAHEVTVAAQAFGEALAARYKVPVHPVDERLTSFAANEALVERRQRGDHRKLRAGDIDAAAAAMILTDWLAAAPGTREMD